METGGIDSEDSRGTSSSFDASAFAPVVVSVIGSDNFESMLDLPTSEKIPGLLNAGLSGREGSSEEVRLSDLGLSLFTAFANRSCNREFGRLCEEARDGAA